MVGRLAFGQHDDWPPFVIADSVERAAQPALVRPINPERAAFSRGLPPLRLEMGGVDHQPGHSALCRQLGEGAVNTPSRLQRMNRL